MYTSVRHVRPTWLGSTVQKGKVARSGSGRPHHSNLSIKQTLGQDRSTRVTGTAEAARRRWGGVLKPNVNHQAHAQAIPTCAALCGLVELGQASQNRRSSSHRAGSYKRFGKRRPDRRVVGDAQPEVVGLDGPVRTPVRRDWAAPAEEREQVPSSVEGVNVLDTVGVARGSGILRPGRRLAV